MLRINALLLVILLAGCSQVPESATYAQKASENKTLLVDQYYIGVDDIVIVNVWKNPDLSIQVPVRPDGKISVPLAGEILAGGKTPVDVASEITKKLAKFIRDPQVSVILGELRSHEYLSRVRVTGAVRNPISMSFRQGMTVLDVVLAAGGLNEFASANGTKLFRRNQNNLEQLDIDLADILFNGDMTTNYAIQPGDVLSIPERNF